MAKIDLGRIVGKSAYEIAVDNGYEGTEQEWLASMNYDDDINSLQENKVDKVSGKGLSTNDFTNDYKTKLDELSNYDDTDLQNQITQEIENRKSADDDIKNLITSTVDLAIANVVNDAPEDFNTLKEMSDWISEHSEDASAMNSAILENKTNLSAEITNRKNADTSLQNQINGKANSSHTHDDRYYTETEIDTKLNNKVDKVSGKGLSSNDFTTEEKNTLNDLKKYHKGISNSTGTIKYYVVRNIPCNNPIQIIGSVSRLDTYDSIFNFTATGYSEAQMKIVGIWNNSNMYDQTWKSLPFKLFRQSDNTFNLWCEIPSYSVMNIIMTNFKATNYDFVESVFDDTGTEAPQIMSINALNDKNGNDITTTYATKTELNNKVDKNASIAIRGTTYDDVTYGDENPYIEFSETNGSQPVRLSYTSYDSYQAPASITINGQQGGEYFIAPNIKATGKFYGNLSGTATKLETARTINVQDHDGTNNGTGASFDGSGNATIKLPEQANIIASCATHIPIGKIDSEVGAIWIGE